MSNEIKFEGTITLADKELRQWVSRIQTQIDVLNERTRRQTKDIHELRKMINKSQEVKQNGNTG